MKNYYDRFTEHGSYYKVTSVFDPDIEEELVYCDMYGNELEDQHALAKTFLFEYFKVILTFQYIDNITWYSKKNPEDKKALALKDKFQLYETIIFWYHEFKEDQDPNTNWSDRITYGTDQGTHIIPAIKEKEGYYLIRNGKQLPIKKGNAVKIGTRFFLVQSIKKTKEGIMATITDWDRFFIKKDKK